MLYHFVGQKLHCTVSNLSQIILYLHEFFFPEIAELRKKFEEDKQRISLMKASRKFRPY